MFLSLPCLALTIFNTAPGVKGLSQEYFQNTDILCLNETEASLSTTAYTILLHLSYKQMYIHRWKG